MNTKSINSQYSSTAATIHAEERYQSRFDSGDVLLVTAWERGVRVEAPDKEYQEARLHPPSDLLMTTKGGVITTVLFASRERVKALGKIRCQGCGHPHEPLKTNETCPWCGSTAEVGRSTGQITLIRNGGD